MSPSIFACSLLLPLATHDYADEYSLLGATGSGLRLVDR